MEYNRYPHLFQGGQIGPLRTRNRIVMAPTETLYASACGEVTPQIIEYYRRRAKGGVGLIVLHSVQGNTAVDRLDPYAGSLRMDNHAFIPMMSDLTEAVHEEGAKISLLLSIGGGAAGAGEAYLGYDVRTARRVGPSDQPSVNALTEAEIRQTVDAFGRCAWRARAAGFDALTIHALGSYLLAEFLSPLHNRRTDAYGGSPANRWRLLFELIDACRRQAGPDFPVMVRMSLDEMHPNGRTLAETLSFLPQLEQAGVAALDLTAGLMEPVRRSIASIYVPPGINAGLIRQAKACVSIPVISGGRMGEPAQAEALLAGGDSDFVSLGRALIADPDWPCKAATGREEELRRCLSCNYCLGHRIMQRLPLRCAVNPYAGRETERPYSPARTSHPRRIAVLGGGPAGLEAARVLGQAGHRVDVYEAGSTLCGGQLAAAACPPCKESLLYIPRFYAAALARLPEVAVHLNTSLDAEQALCLQVDCFIVATGAIPAVPPIPGLDGEQVVTAQQALTGQAAVGDRVLVLGGGQIGAETAHFLAVRGKQVTIVELLPELIPQEEPNTRRALLHLLDTNGVEVYVNCRVEALHPGCAAVRSADADTSFSLPFDTAVLAFGTRANDPFSIPLQAAGRTVFVIGDARQSGNIASAIRSAHHTAQCLVREWS